MKEKVIKANTQVRNVISSALMLCVFTIADLASLCHMDIFKRIMFKIHFVSFFFVTSDGGGAWALGGRFV